MLTDAFYGCEEVKKTSRFSYFFTIKDGAFTASRVRLVFYSLRGLPSRSQRSQTSFQAFFHLFFFLLFDTRRKIMNKDKFTFICLACPCFTCIVRNLASEELLRQVLI